MKNLFKRYLLVFLGLSLIGACSDDNEPMPMDNPERPFVLSIFDDDNFVTVPNAMLQAGDAQANVAAAYVTSANGFLLFNAFFTPPAGLQSTTNKITASNGRVAAEYKVYEWSDGSGNGVAYQYSIQNGKHVLEVFIKESGANYLKFIHAEQSENGKEGTMKFLDVDGINPALVALTYSWSVATDGVRHLTLEDAQDFLNVKITSNPDQSGEMNIYQDGSLVANYLWDAIGNGSWIAYNSDGSVADQGNWTV